MKKSCWGIHPYLLLAILLGACASRPQVTIEEPAEDRIEHPPPVLMSPIDQMLYRIQQNGADIVKFFILDNEGRIIVKADLCDTAGDFEIMYDLEGARALGNSTYAVGFSARNRETGDIIEDTLIWKPRAGTAGLLLSFDDDYLEVWERHFNLFDMYGARVTFFLQGEYDPFGARAMRRGHDIGYHGLNHLDLRSISRAAFIRETIASAEAFRQTGIPLASFAFPYGFSDPWMHEILLGDYTVLRGYGVTFRLFTKDQIRSAFISSRAIDNTVIPTEDHFDRLIRSMLRTLRFLDGSLILPLTSHDISDAPWAISPRRLEFLLKTASDLGLRYFLYRDFAVKH